MGKPTMQGKRCLSGNRKNVKAQTLVLTLQLSPFISVGHSRLCCGPFYVLPGLLLDVEVLIGHQGALQLKMHGIWICLVIRLMAKIHIEAHASERVRYYDDV